jgi:hypothetical protein
MSNSLDILNQVKTQMSGLQRLLNNEDSDVSSITSKSNKLIELLSQLNDFLTRDISEFDYYAGIIDKYDLNRLPREISGKIRTTAESIDYFDDRLNIQIWRQPAGAAMISLVMETQAKAPEDVLELFEFLVELHNNSDYARSGDLWELYIPKVGSRFERSEQISTVDVIGGEIIDVYLPGIIDMKGRVIAKAVVLVK